MQMFVGLAILAIVGCAIQVSGAPQVTRPQRPTRLSILESIDKRIITRLENRKVRIDNRNKPSIATAVAPIEAEGVPVSNGSVPSAMLHRPLPVTSIVEDVNDGQLSAEALLSSSVVD